jgi:hypothetical protein
MVDEAAIRRSFSFGNMVAAHLQDLMGDHYREAKRLAPYRTGRLRRLHYRRMGPASAAPARTYYVGTTAGYAHFLWGTAGKGAGRITSRSDIDLMEMRPMPYSYFTVAQKFERMRRSVQGQPEHKRVRWLEIAARNAFIMNRLLDKTGKPI